MEPITTELRKLMTHTVDGFDLHRPLVECDRETFERLCDEIDAVHEGLERENAELRERVAELDKRGESMHDGGRITDELRAWWVRKFPVMDKELHKDFTAIADRIDAEHERECKEQYACGAEHGIGVSIDALVIQTHGFVELPKDADGEYIHVGDRLDGYGKTIEVVELRHGRSGWVLISRDGNGYADTFAFVHHKPTVEDVLREFAYGLGVPVADSYVAATAAKLQLRGGAE